MTMLTGETRANWTTAWLESRRRMKDDSILWRDIVSVCDLMVQVDGLYHDLYKTLGGVRETSSCKFPQEPTEDCRLILGIDARHNGAFRNACLTTPYVDPRRYLEALGKPYGIVPTEEMTKALATRIALEMQLLYLFFEVKPVLKCLSRVYRQGLITDSWPFPIEKLLVTQGLNNLFEHVVVSSLEGVCKGDGDGTEIYKIAAAKMNVPPHKLCMIGDDPYRDCLPAMKVGFKVILVDRDYEHVDRGGNWKDSALADLDIPVIRCYEHLPVPVAGLSGTAVLGGHVSRAGYLHRN